MDIKEAIRSGLKELILPELNSIKSENKEIKTQLTMTNKRLDDINLHLADQSRRIDGTNKRIDDMNKKFDERFDDVNRKFDYMNDKIDKMRDFVFGQMTEIHKRLDSLYQAIVRKEDHEKLDLRVMKLEEELARIKDKIAA